MAKHPKAAKTEIELIESEAKDVMALHEKAGGKIKGKGSAEINRRTALLLEQVYARQAPVPLEVLKLVSLRLGVPADPFVMNTVGPGVDPKYVKQWNQAVLFEANCEAKPIGMSAFGGKADVNHQPSECPLIAKSGHWDGAR